LQDLGWQIWSTKYGLTLTPDSLSWLEKMIEHYELEDINNVDIVEAFNKAMEDMAKCYTGSMEDYAQIVDVNALEDVYARLQAVEGNVDALLGNDGPSHHDGNNSHDHATGDLLDRSAYIKIIDSFSMPWIHFDGEKKSFVHHNNMTTSTGTGQSARKYPSLAGGADSKAQYLRDRYNILKQVILRNEHFSPPALPGHDRENYMKVGSSSYSHGFIGFRLIPLAVS
jgi:DNA polymerase epsilon subunit 2